VIVEHTHHVDRIPADVARPVVQRYECDIFRFSNDNAVLIARQYSGEPDAAHFLRRELGSDHFGLTQRDLATPLFRSAVSYLRDNGISRIEWLNIEGEGYESISA
jgi:hypothetical protein